MQIQYASKSTINELSKLNNLLNVKLNRMSGMGDLIPTHEAQFLRIASMNSSVSDSLKVTLLIASLSNMSEYRSIIASVNTIQQKLRTWSYVSMFFIGESRRLCMSAGSRLSQHENQQEGTFTNINRYPTREFQRDGILKEEHTLYAATSVIRWVT